MCWLGLTTLGVIWCTTVTQRRPRGRRLRCHQQVTRTCADVITVRRHSGVWSGHVVALVVRRDDVPAGCRSVVDEHLTASARLDLFPPGTGDDVEVACVDWWWNGLCNAPPFALQMYVVIVRFQRRIYATHKKSGNHHGKFWSGKHHRKCSRILPFSSATRITVIYVTFISYKIGNLDVHWEDGWRLNSIFHRK